MLERLKELEAKATPGPWESCFETYGCFEEETTMKSTSPDVDDAQVIGTGWHDGHHAVLREDDAQLIATLRNLAPELIAVWEAANKAGKLFNASMGTFDPSDEPTYLTEAALDALHKGWIGFAETVNALNNKAKSTMVG